MVGLLVDDKEITAESGGNLLAVCLQNNIYIPHLCFLEGEERQDASCRLCFVEIDNTGQPVPACTITPVSGMVVKTDTPAVRSLQRSALRLLLSDHDVDCKNCHANRACALQKIARFLEVGLKARPLARLERVKAIDSSHPYIDHYPHRCVLCGKCVRTCARLHERPPISFVGRGRETVIKHYLSDAGLLQQCRNCRSCLEVCPVGALQYREAATGADELKS